MGAALSPVPRAAATVALALALAWFAGGQAALGRIDPALVLPLMPMPALLLAWLQHREGWRHRMRVLLLALAALLAVQGLLAAWLGGGASIAQLAAVAAGGALAGVAADAIVQFRRARRIGRAALASLFALCWFVGAHGALAALYRPPAVGGAPVTLMTSLPLRWAAGGDMAATIAQGTGDDAALSAIAAMGPVRLVDSVADHPPAAGGVLLLAHPPALAPRDLVAIDSYVRGGGRAVVLADALSGWPLRYPLGDPRNPPITSLMTPLLDHWGVTLAAAPAGEQRPLAVDVGDMRLRLFSAGAFDRLPAACRAFAGRRFAHCRVGRGDLWLVGDADLLFAPLWQASPPWAVHLRQADTMEWLAQRLHGAAARAWLRPVWIRAADR